MSKSLSVVVPAYNEESTLHEIVDRLLALPEVLELIIVDDCSNDGTAKIADELALAHPEIRVAHHPVNKGKTEALKTGFAMTRGDIVIVQDADLEYDPAEICEVIAPILSGDADVVYGSRFLVRKASRVLYFYHFLANKGLTFLSNLCTNVNVTDVETCYKAFRGEIIRNMIITSSGFGFEIEVTAKVAKLKAAMYEVPISYYGRTYEQGKKIGMKDGFAALWYIVRFNFLCSLEDSFRKIPQLSGGRNRASHDRSEKDHSDSGDSEPGGAPAKSATDSGSASSRGNTLCLLAMLFFFAVSCFFIPLIGTEDDELLFIPPVWHPGQIFNSFSILGRHIPAMLMSYVGADKTLLYGPLIRILPSSMWVLRLPVVLIGLLTLWILFSVMRRLAGERVALALVWLLATDSMFLLSTTFDWGPVAIQHLLLLAGFALLARPQPRVFLGALAFGLAFWDKGTAIWAIGAFAVSAVIFLPKQTLASVSSGNMWKAAGGVLLGAWPILAFNIRHHGATFTENTGFTTAGLDQKLQIMWMTLTGSGFFGFMVDGDAPRWVSLAPFAIALAVPFVFHPGVRAVRPLALFSLSSGVIIWLGMLFVKNGGTSVHHTILVWPWPQVFAMCVLGYALGSSALGRSMFLALVVAIVVSNVAVLGAYAQRAWQSGPSVTWSDATLTLPRTFPGTSRVLVLDWGIYNIATYLTRGKVRIEDRAFGGLQEDDTRNLEGTEFLSHVDGREVVAGTNARFEAAIGKKGLVRVVDRVFKDSRGRPVLMSFHAGAAGLASTN